LQSPDVRGGAFATGLSQRQVRAWSRYAPMATKFRNAAKGAMRHTGRMQRSIIRSDRRRGQQSWRDGEVGLALPLMAEKGTSVIPVLNQYKRIGCSPGRHSDTQTMATGSDDDSRDNVHDRCLCIAVWWSEHVPRYQSRDLSSAALAAASKAWSGPAPVPPRIAGGR
jgi:hypothetical protein